MLHSFSGVRGGVGEGPLGWLPRLEKHSASAEWLRLAGVVVFSILIQFCERTVGVNYWLEALVLLIAKSSAKLATRKFSLLKPHLLTT